MQKAALGWWDQEVDGNEKVAVRRDRRTRRRFILLVVGVDSSLKAD